jgi:translocation and assembly module TamA
MLFVPLRLSARPFASAAVSLLLTSAAAYAQDAVDAVQPFDPGLALDPGSALAPLPDLGVEWPDLSAPDEAPSTEPQKTPDAVDVATNRRYHVTIEGLESVGGEELRTRFKALSALIQDEDKSANAAQIDRRARQDEALLRELLRAYGYYDATVTTRVDSSDAARVLVNLQVEPGPLYRFSEVSLRGIEAAGPKAGELGTAFNVGKDDPVNADKVTAALTNLKLKLGREGFPFAKVGEPEIIVDHESRTATLALAVDPDGARKFGAIRLENRKLFGPKHVARMARFRPGDPYDSAMVDDLRRALIQTGLVSQVELRPVQTAQPDVVDLMVKLEPAPPHTIAGEVGYGTGEGFRVEASWTHRNLIRPEGAVTLRGVAGTREQLAGATLRRSNFKQRDQVLTAQVIASHTNRDAYDARTFTLGGGIERQTNIIWQKKWTWSFGAELVASDEKDVIVSTGEPRRRTFFIGAIPTSLSYDGSDDLLNPTRGYRLSGRLSPEASFQGSVFGYSKMQIDGSAYVPITDGTIIAGRLRFGSIAGASRDRIAPSRRFYAGGGGSVRGFGYQDIGPMDVNGDPVGGRSLAEFSLEARVRFGNFGVVPFLDGGNVYSSALPKMTGLRYGVGIGARYHTNFGPIRIDLGTPLNRRKGEPRVAVYVSLGQAF